MKLFTYKTIIISSMPEYFYQVVDSSMLMAKNIANPTLFLIKNVLTSYDYTRLCLLDNKELVSYYQQKEELHINQKQTIDLFNQVIQMYNETRTIKYQDKLKNYQTKLEQTNTNNLNHGNSSNNMVKQSTNIKSLEEPKEFISLPLLTQEISIKDLQNILTHAVLIDNVLKQKELMSSTNNNNDNTSENNDKGKCYKDYSNISSYIASISVIQTVQNVANYFKAIASYWKTYAENKKNSINIKASPPQLPKYLDKNDRFTFELHHQRFSQSGTLFTINPKKHKIYTDFHNPEVSQISLDTIEKFNSYNFLENLEKELESKINKKSYISAKYKGLNPNLKQLKTKQNYQLQTVRFVSLRKNVLPQELIQLKGKYKKSLKIEATVKIETEINDDSPLAKIINYYNQIKTVKENSQDYELKIKLLGKNFKEEIEFLELTDKKQQKIVSHCLETSSINKRNINHINNNLNSDNAPNEPKPFTRYGGLDLGKINMASLALTHGDNIVYSGKYINQHVTHLNKKLDAIKSSIFQQSLSKELFDKVLYNQEVQKINSFDYSRSFVDKNNVELLEEQKKIREIFIKKYNLTNNNDKVSNSTNNVLKEKLLKKELSQEEHKEIRLANRKVYQNINYINTLIKLESFKKQTLHQLSTDILNHCLKNKIEVLVIGKNKNWKTEVGMGSETNRIFTIIPHSKLIEQIQYKAVLKGIVVVLTEESYTSQSSFVHGDALPEFKEKDLNIKNNNKKMEKDNNQSHLDVVNTKTYQFNGKRYSNSFVLNKKIDKIKIIHADINAGFNIIRKIFKNFLYNVNINLSYRIKGLNNKKKTVFSYI